MPSIQVLNMQGASVGEMQLKDEIFAIEPNTAAMHLVVRSILANKRQGTQSALTRGMVRGGGRLPHRHPDMRKQQASKTGSLLLLPFLTCLSRGRAHRGRDCSCRGIRPWPCRRAGRPPRSRAGRAPADTPRRAPP